MHTEPKQYNNSHLDMENATPKVHRFLPVVNNPTGHCMSTTVTIPDPTTQMTITGTGHSEELPIQQQQHAHHNMGTLDRNSVMIPFFTSMNRSQHTRQSATLDAPLKYANTVASEFNTIPVPLKRKPTLTRFSFDSDGNEHEVLLAQSTKDNMTKDTSLNEMSFKETISDEIMPRDSKSTSEIKEFLVAQNISTHTLPHELDLVKHQPSSAESPHHRTLTSHSTTFNSSPHGDSIRNTSHSKQPSSSSSSSTSANSTSTTASVRSPNSIVPLSSSKRYKALQLHIPGRFDELTISVGDQIVIIQAFRDGWALGHNLATNHIGVFPMHCVLE
jgi:hypothetical protein